MTIQEAQHKIDGWIKQYGVRYFSELTNLAVLVEEVGELSRLMARRYGDQSVKPGEVIDDEKLAEELADVLFVLLCIANQTGTNMDKALEKSLEKKTKRDKDRHITNTKLTNNGQ